MGAERSVRAGVWLYPHSYPCVPLLHGMPCASAPGCAGESPGGPPSPYQHFMPKLTIPAGATGSIPSAQRYNVPSTRRGIVFTLISGDAYWGWTSTVTASGNTDAGIPLTTGAPVALHSAGYDFSGPINIFSPGGCVVHYQELNG